MLPDKSGTLVPNQFQNAPKMKSRTWRKFIKSITERESEHGDDPIFYCAVLFLRWTLIPKHLKPSRWWMNKLLFNAFSLQPRSIWLTLNLIEFLDSLADPKGEHVNHDLLPTQLPKSEDKSGTVGLCPSSNPAPQPTPDTQPTSASTKSIDIEPTEAAVNFLRVGNT